jgi:hypothetical protein
MDSSIKGTGVTVRVAIPCRVDGHKGTFLSPRANEQHLNPETALKMKFSM